MAKEATHVCLDCQSPTAPTRRRQHQMFAWSVILGVAVPIAGNALGIWESDHHDALFTIAGLLFFGSLWWPAQCRTCDGTRVAPLGSMVGRRYAAELVQRANADAVSSTGT